MEDLRELIWVEKYRPSSFDDLILGDKNLLLKFLANPKTIPSFIFYSAKPGTGKTSTAKLVGKFLDCDVLLINSSDERGIDTIREKINLFARSLSSNEKVKRCVFLDEADGLTKQAQDSLRNLMEEYSDNCFFIFTANDISKIIEPVRSRCQLINFERPDANSIIARLLEITEAEKLNIPMDALSRLANDHYPDIRKMINSLQLWSANDGNVIDSQNINEEFLNMVLTKDVTGIYNAVYSNKVDMMSFNRWMFKWLFDNYKPTNADKCRRIASYLADTEKHWSLNCNLEIIFIANILEIMKEI